MLLTVRVPFKVLQLSIKILVNGTLEMLPIWNPHLETQPRLIMVVTQEQIL